jgi:hypothetical protein
VLLSQSNYAGPWLLTNLLVSREAQLHAGAAFDHVGNQCTCKQLNANSRGQPPGQTSQQTAAGWKQAARLRNTQQINQHMG